MLKFSREWKFYSKLSGNSPLCIIKQQSGDLLRLTFKYLKLTEAIPENLEIIIFHVPKPKQEIDSTTDGLNEDPTHR